MGGNTQSGNTIPWENWLHGAFSGVSRRQQGLVIFYLFIGLMWSLLYAPRAAGTPRVEVGMTQMLFKGAHGLSVSPLLPDGKGPLGRMGSLTPGSSSSSGSGNASPQLPSWSSPGSSGHQLSPPFERSRQMLSRLLRRWARKQQAAFKVQSSAGPNPPPHPAVKHRTPCPSLEAPRAPGSPVPPAPHWDAASEQLPGPGLRPDRAAHLSSCAAPALRLQFATEKLGGRENFSSRPRQELKTYALAANASPGARGDQGEPSAGFSSAAPAGRRAALLPELALHRHPWAALGW